MVTPVLLVMVKVITFAIHILVRVRGYSTIDQESSSDSIASKHIHNELEPNWCEGTVS